MSKDACNVYVEIIEDLKKQIAHLQAQLAVAQKQQAPVKPVARLFMPRSQWK